MLIVDGNNIATARRPWHPAAWIWQRRLVMDVARLTREWEMCADVVFDGYPRAGLSAVEAGVRIWFGRSRSADDVIAELVHHLPPREAIVATSDRGLAKRVTPSGARVVSNDALRRALDRVAAPAHAGKQTRSPLLEGPRALFAMDRELALERIA